MWDKRETNARFAPNLAHRKCEGVRPSDCHWAESHGRGLLPFPLGLGGELISLTGHGAGPQPSSDSVKRCLSSCCPALCSHRGAWDDLQGERSHIPNPNSTTKQGQTLNAGKTYPGKHLPAPSPKSPQQYRAFTKHLEEQTPRGVEVKNQKPLYR